MALLRRMGPDAQLPTDAAAVSVSGGVVHGNLWLLGHGDPGISNYRLNILAQHVKAAGITQITGHVMGSTGYFSHDWFAPGWKADFPKDEVALPTALDVQPEHARTACTSRIPSAARPRRWHNACAPMGSRWAGRPGWGRPPGGLHVVAEIVSAKLGSVIRPMDVSSLNFDAEVLGKRLAVSRYGPPGTIARGASTIHQFAASVGVNATCYDASGLSYSNHVSAFGIVTLLQYADTTDLAERAPPGAAGRRPGHAVGPALRRPGARQDRDARRHQRAVGVGLDRAGGTLGRVLHARRAATRRR